ncbi:MAG TPA: NAD(P)/FAD-dependent oxidoreductase [Chthoniobacteraceae bacterium]|jgi:thioredoxin reductase|nr:NAD(P)/FAD-dependent oxidoreductase [Chthoniobacteraceae bacterium]
MQDVIIVGGGPAGLSAALVLGRCRRQVLLFDSGQPRNYAARAMHGFISRDGTSPEEFRRLAREQLAKYPCVEVRDGVVVDAQRGDEQFTVTLEDGTTHTARILLLATGLVDDVPKVNGMERFYGTGVHVCPYCDGWEHNDQTIVVYGQGQMGADLALEMLAWSSDVTWCTDGDEEEVPAGCRSKLRHYQVRIIRSKIAQLEGEGDRLRGVRFVDGEFLPCDAVFFASTQRQHSDLAEKLGCQVCADEVAMEHDDTASAVPGLYVAGNTSRGLQLVIMAAADGTLAAFKINEDLLEADLARHAEVISEPEESNQ